MTATSAAETLYGALDLKQNEVQNAVIQNLSAAPTSPKEGQYYYNSTTKQALLWNGAAWIDLSQIINSAYTAKGAIANAASNPAYPANPAAGDTYHITTQAGMVGTTPVTVNDLLIYSDGGWYTLAHGQQMASQTVAGYTRYATPAELVAGADPGLAVSAATLVPALTAAGYVRKSRVLIPSLTANVVTTVPHGLGLANMEDLVVSFAQGGVPVRLPWQPLTVNSISVVSTAALGNVTVIAIG